MMHGPMNVKFYKLYLVLKTAAAEVSKLLKGIGGIFSTLSYRIVSKC